jgi:hypothetical protein
MYGEIRKNLEKPKQEFGTQVAINLNLSTNTPAAFNLTSPSVITEKLILDWRT